MNQKKENKGNTQVYSWLGGSVGWSAIPYTKRLWVPSPVRARVGGAMFLSHVSLLYPSDLAAPLVRIYPKEVSDVVSNCLFIMVKISEEKAKCLSIRKLYLTIMCVCIFVYPNNTIPQKWCRKT